MGLSNAFFRRKKQKPVNTTPPWMYVLLLVFLIYSATRYNDKTINGQHNPIPEAVEQTGKMLTNENLKETYSNVKNLLFPAYAATLDIADISEGKGLPAVCGQDVKVSYTAKFQNGADIKDATLATPRSFRIGDASIMPALEQGVSGMKIGGKRRLVAAPSMAYGSTKFALKNSKETKDAENNERVEFIVEMLGISPVLPDIENSAYRIANIGDPHGGIPIFCGETVNLNITVWNVAGKKLYSSKDNAKPVTFIPGNSEIAVGIEQGIIGMIRGGFRTLVLPPEFQKTLRGTPAKIAFPFPAAQTVLVDIEALP